MPPAPVHVLGPEAPREQRDFERHAHPRDITTLARALLRRVRRTDLLEMLRTHPPRPSRTFWRRQARSRRREKAGRSLRHTRSLPARYRGHSLADRPDARETATEGLAARPSNGRALAPGLKVDAPSFRATLEHRIASPAVGAVRPYGTTRHYESVVTYPCSSGTNLWIPPEHEPSALGSQQLRRMPGCGNPHQPQPPTCSDARSAASRRARSSASRGIRAARARASARTTGTRSIDRRGPECPSCRAGGDWVGDLVAVAVGHDLAHRRLPCPVCLAVRRRRGDGLHP